MSASWIPRIQESRLDAIPVAAAIAAPDLADRVRGMLLGVAIGDALGNRSESRSPQRRFEEFGHITDYLPNRHVRGRRVGTPSDDTQLTFWTVEHLLEHGHLEPDALSTVFASRQIYGRGRATGDFVHARQAGASWQDAGQASAGNGALMRIAPIVLPHLRGDRASLSRETAIAAAITHNDPLAIASAVAWVALLWRLLGGDVSGSPVAWLDGYINVLRPLDHDQEYVTRLPEGPLRLGARRHPRMSLVRGRPRASVRVEPRRINPDAHPRGRPMRLLFDQNLSHRLLQRLADVYPDSRHVRDVGLARAADDLVWMHARDNGLTIVSKDADFHQRSFLFGAPPKVIWLRSPWAGDP